MQATDNKTALQLHKRELKLMGNRFEITVVSGDDALWANERIDAAVAEIQRIERLFTTFSEDSQTNLINRNAGIEPVEVDREMFELIARSIKISRLTQGAFDITYGSIDKSLWNFDQNMKALPDTEVARQSVRLVNYQNIILDDARCTVFLKEKGMRIGFGGIGKGYAADKAKWLMQQQGVKSGVVNAAGDLNAWGLQPNGQKWTIGISNPDLKDEVFSHMSVSDMAVVTSGNYEKYAVIDGKKYSHTINPRTGLPVTGIKSVTIITTHAEIADALATPVMVMGINAGLNLVNQMKDIAAVIIDDNNYLYTSKNINLK
jgi:thiamine biosynthesis lipoprotein